MPKEENITDFGFVSILTINTHVYKMFLRGFEIFHSLCLKKLKRLVCFFFFFSLRQVELAHLNLQKFRFQLSILYLILESLKGFISLMKQIHILCKLLFIVNSNQWEPKKSYDHFLKGPPFAKKKFSASPKNKGGTVWRGGQLRWLPLIFFLLPHAMLCLKFLPNVKKYHDVT